MSATGATENISRWTGRISSSMRERSKRNPDMTANGYSEPIQNLQAEMVALKYKELWQVEQAFRDIKSVLETRPVYHQTDETIRGHVFCSFLALVLRKELDSRLEKAGHCFEWADIKQDLKALQEVRLRSRKKAWPSEPSAWEPAEKSFRRSALRSLQRSGSCKIVKEQNVVPRLFSWHLCH